VTWSCLMLIHICLMSDDCYEALQCLVPSIRYFFTIDIIFQVRNHRHLIVSPSSS
jgi:hypothetical protein